MPPGRRSPSAHAMRRYVQARLASGKDLSFEQAMEAPEPWGDTLHAGAGGGAGISRRDLLKWGAAAGAGVALSGSLASRAAAAGGDEGVQASSARKPTVVVVGAGLAGLTAGYRLMKAGLKVNVYEARDRVGGRCWTSREGWTNGQTAEHGGEFIDTRHVHIVQMIKEMNLKLEDLWEGWPGGGWPSVVDGDIVYGVNALLKPVSDEVETAAKQIGAVPKGEKPNDTAMSHGTATAKAIAMDQFSAAEWIESKVPGFDSTTGGRLLNADFASWYGMDLDGVSALNLVDYFVIPYPGGDERYHVLGGNDLVPNKLAAKLGSRVHMDSPLEAMLERGNGSYELTFTGMGSPVVADYVVLAMPFTALRDVDLTQAGLTNATRTLIDTLAMGTNAKLLLQFDSRPFDWLDQDGSGWSGGFNNTPPDYQVWESSTNQVGSEGLMTVFSGGDSGAIAFAGPDAHGATAPQPLIDDTVDQIDAVAPGYGAEFNGKAWLDHWTGDPWVKGSYAAFGPGQYTEYWRNSGRRDGRVHFAGEQTSSYSQGFLNGGVESGNRAAIEILKRLKLNVPRSYGRLPYSKFT